MVIPFLKPSDEHGGSQRLDVCTEWQAENSFPLGGEESTILSQPLFHSEIQFYHSDSYSSLFSEAGSHCVSLAVLELTL